MKTAIYIEQGLTQLVLTPENKFEEALISQVEKGGFTVNVHTGSFYECQGGWVRQGNDDRSLILVMPIKPPNIGVQK